MDHAELKAFLSQMDAELGTRHVPLGADPTNRRTIMSEDPYGAPLPEDWDVERGNPGTTPWGAPVMMRRPEPPHLVTCFAPLDERLRAAGWQWHVTGSFHPTGTGGLELLNTWSRPAALVFRVDQQPKLGHHVLVNGYLYTLEVPLAELIQMVEYVFEATPTGVWQDRIEELVEADVTEQPPDDAA